MAAAAVAAAAGTAAAAQQNDDQNEPQAGAVAVSVVVEPHDCHLTFSTHSMRRELEWSLTI
jgi:hypothetical protein